MRTGSAAVAWSIGESRNPTMDLAGYCLRATRLAFDAPGGAPSAIADWNSKSAGHKFTSWPPPAAVPVYWKIGRYGHIAMSGGDGYTWSTDILRHGKIDKVKISYVNSRWGAQYLGWSDTVNGVDIYDAKPKPIPIVSMAKLVEAGEHDIAAADGTPGLHPGTVRPVEQALVHVGLLDDRYLDGSWGTRSRKALAAYRARYPHITWEEGLHKLADDTKIFKVAA